MRRFRNGNRRRQVHQLRQNAGQLETHFRTANDHIDRPFFNQKLTALESRRQLLAYGLLDNARTGKADQRFRLGNVQIAQHRKARRYAAHGRVGQHGDVRQSALLHFRQRRGGFRHLHQRHQRFLHTGAPEAEKQISGQLSSSACSTARTKRAPTTEPIDPPIKENSKAAATTGIA